MKYERILLKLSGEALMGEKQYGVDNKRLKEYAEEVLSVKKSGVEVAIVIGGGNIYRGKQTKDDNIDRAQGDYIGMLATVINSMFLQDKLEEMGADVKVLSGISIEPLCEKMSRRKAIDYLKDGYIVIIAGGTGNPYFTTDTASALRAIEIKADAIFKGTKVDGVYDSDPMKNRKAKKFDKITFDEVIARQLQVMDQTAFTLCKENKLPIVVFNMNVKGNLKKLIKGDKIGTIIN
jgi:uridylate kinase